VTVPEKTDVGVSYTGTESAGISDGSQYEAGRMKGPSTYPVDRATGHPRPEIISLCSHVQCHKANSRRKSKTEATTPTPKPRPALTRRSAACTVSINSSGYSSKESRCLAGCTHAIIANSMLIMDDGKGDVDIRSCRTVRSSASLAAIPQNRRTFFEIMSSLATDLVAGGVDMVADGT
jgi:hypothetical protein